MTFLIKLDLRALNDIQNAIDYYDYKQIGLGEKFEIYLNKYFKSLSKNPFYQNRYDNIHCLPLKKYPFMIHFSIEEKEKSIYVHAVLNTYLNPKENWVNKNI